MSRSDADRENRANSGFTSMIDIVFLLLIFFILQPFRMPDMQLKTELPTVGGDGPGDCEPIHLDVRGEADRVTYFVNGHAAGSGGAPLSRKIMRMSLGRSGEVPVVIDADRDLHFSHVLHAYDECLVAGTQEVRFTKPVLNDTATDTP